MALLAVIPPTRLGRLAFQEADHLPDSELGRSPAAAVHKSDRPRDRAAVCEADHVRGELVDRAGAAGWAASDHSDFEAHKFSS